jgi:hypothetical protein
VVAPCSTSERVHAFPGKATTLVSGVGLAIVCAVGDLNGDGRSDLALGGYGNIPSLYTTELTETATATANISRRKGCEWGPGVIANGKSPEDQRR